jgi:hypothetical protein
VESAEGRDSLFCRNPPLCPTKFFFSALLLPPPKNLAMNRDKDDNSASQLADQNGWHDKQTEK